MLRTYREVLARPGALAFSTAAAVARLPISMVGIGIILMVSEVYGSYALAGRVSAVYVTVHALCSPPLSRFVDRHGQARVMRPAVVVTAIGLTTLVVLGAARAGEWALYAAAAVTGATAGSMGALVRARWSASLSDPRLLHTAYSLESAVDEMVFIVGPVLATFLATSVSPTAGLVVPAVAVLAGGLWFLAQRETEPPTVQRDPSAPGRSPVRSASMVVLLVVFVAIGSILGATDVAVVAFAEERGAKSTAGVLLAVLAAGSLLAGLGYGARQWVGPQWRRFVVGTMLLATGVCLFLLAHSLPVLAAAMFVTGFAVAPTIINGNGLVQELVAPGQLTEGLAWIGTAIGFGVSAGAAVGGAMVDRAGSHGGFLVVVASAGCAVVAALGSARVLRRAAEGARPDLRARTDDSGT